MKRKCNKLAEGKLPASARTPRHRSGQAVPRKTIASTLRFAFADRSAISTERLAQDLKMQCALGRCNLWPSTPAIHGSFRIRCNEEFSCCSTRKQTLCENNTAIEAELRSRRRVISRQRSGDSWQNRRGTTGSAGDCTIVRDHRFPRTPANEEESNDSKQCGFGHRVRQFAERPCPLTNSGDQSIRRRRSSLGNHGLPKRLHPGRS